MQPPGGLAQVVEHVVEPRRDRFDVAPAGLAALAAANARSFIVRVTSRCCAPSWRSRSIRLRVWSAVVTIRDLEASSSARLSAFATAVPTRSVNSARRASRPARAGRRSIRTSSRPTVVPRRRSAPRPPNGSRLRPGPRAPDRRPLEVVDASGAAGAPHRRDHALAGQRNRDPTSKPTRRASPGRSPSHRLRSA